MSNFVSRNLHDVQRSGTASAVLTATFGTLQRNQTDTAGEFTDHLFTTQTVSR